MQNARLKSEPSISLKPDFDFNYSNQKDGTKQKAVSKEINHFDTSHISPDAIIFTNVKGEIRYINSEAQHLTGWFTSDAMNTKIGEVFKIYDIETEEKLGNPVDKVLITNSKIDLTSKIILLSKDRLKFEIEYKASPKYSQDGKLNKIILTFKKIREIQNTFPQKNINPEKIERKQNVTERSKKLSVSINELSHKDIDKSLDIINDMTERKVLSAELNPKFDTKKEIVLTAEHKINADESIKNSNLKVENNKVYSISKHEEEILKPLDFMRDI